jgi:glyoxylase-like metal-dependent hydrolase (beta-lactamase superfamily II)
MTRVEPIALPLPMIYLGSVNVWLFKEDPVTLVDTGPATADALATLEQQLSINGVAFSDIEMVLLTHHHLDHSALANTIKTRSGASIIAHRGTAQWGERWEQHVASERDFTRALIAQHGVPESLWGQADRFSAMISTDGRPYDVDRVLSDGDTFEAGGRRWRTVFRPGHSTTDTLYVDDDSGEALVGDHLLAKITTAAELGPTEMPGDERRRALMEYLGNLRKTQVMPIARCFTGHGPIIEDHRVLIDERIEFHSDRLAKIYELVAEGHATAYDISCRLWSEDVAATSPVLVVWEVLGHLDLLINRGLVREQAGDAGDFSFRAQQPVGAIAPIG